MVNSLLMMVALWLGDVIYMLSTLGTVLLSA